MATEQPDPRSVYAQVDDIVRVRDTGDLGFIEHVGGETDSEADDDDEPDFWPEGHATLHMHGAAHLPHGVPHVHHGALALSPPAGGTSDGLISGYDDASDDGIDVHEGEVRLDPRVGAGRLAPGQVAMDADGVWEVGAEVSSDDVRIPEGSALLSIFDTGAELVVPIEGLEVVDRAFGPGDVVTKLTPDGLEQSGVVTGITKKLFVRKIEELGTPDAVDTGAAAVFEIPSSRVGFFAGLRDGCFVVRNDWLGMVSHFRENVVVEFPCGACALFPGHAEAIKNDDARASNIPLEDSEGYYFPGQRVKPVGRSWHLDVQWLNGRYTGQRRGVVKAVEITDVGVQWLAVNMCNPSAGAPSPDSRSAGLPKEESVRYADLKPLDTFKHLWWRVGDRGILLDDEDSNTSEAERHGENGVMGEFDNGDDDDSDGWEEVDESDLADLDDSALASVSPTSEARSRHCFMQSDKSRVVQIMGMKTLIDVIWQDGTTSEKEHAVNLRSNDHTGAYDFWPGVYVSRAVDPLDVDRDTSNATEQDKGAIVRVNQQERTAIVRWQIKGSSEYGPEEVVSVYELNSESVFDIQLGDTVLRVGASNAPAAVSGSTPAGHIDSDSDHGWVGTVVGNRIGKYTVQWMNGKRTEIEPEHLVVVGGEEDGESYGSDESGESGNNDDDNSSSGWVEMPSNAASPANGDDSDEFRANWGPDEDGAFNAIQTLAATHDYGWDGDVVPLILRFLETFLETITPHAVPAGLNATLVAEDAVRRVDDMFSPSAGGSASNSEQDVSRVKVMAAMLAAVIVMGRSRDTDSTEELMSNRERASFMSNLERELHTAIERRTPPAARLSSAESTERNENGAEEQQGGRGELPGPTTEPAAVEDMDVKGDAAVDGSEHALTNGDAANDIEKDLPRFETCEALQLHHFATKESAHPAGFPNIVRREWTRLLRNLPEGIFVHGSEARQDTLRAAIVGPADTPYADCMFFFDIMLPSDYPTAPPNVYFYSHGLRLQPNLYENGKVCLSILNTWDGTGVERWNARNSNILRVLLSLQAMVFCELPYYQEAGYEKQIGTPEGRSNSALYNESAFLLTLRHLVLTLRPGGAPEDFAELTRRHYRQRRDAILERCSKLIEDGNATDEGSSSGAMYCTAGFKRSLEQLLPRVKAVLDGLGD